MAISVYNIKRWYLMLRGKSIYHVEQGLGKAIDQGGYFNDMTQKVLLGDENLDANGLPFLVHTDGSHIQMPTMIFQYGLGAYDLWLERKESKYLFKFQQCVDWALQKQEESGAWNNFFYYYPDHPYGSMAQGEGASLMIRAYAAFQDKKYLEAAKKAIDFMLLPIDEGGTTEYSGDTIVMHEYTHRKCVLNGWVFSLFGLYDYVSASGDHAYQDVWDRAVSSLEKMLPEFYTKFWGMYDLDGRISSPFYHHLQIAQMRAMYKITGRDVFLSTANMWEKYENNLFCKSAAFVQKALQKITEKI